MEKPKDFIVKNVSLAPTFAAKQSSGREISEQKELPVHLHQVVLEGTAEGFCERLRKAQGECAETTAIRSAVAVVFAAEPKH